MVCWKMWGENFLRRLHTSRNLSYQFTSTMDTLLNRVESKDMKESERGFHIEIGICRTVMKMYGLWIYKKNSVWTEILCNLQTSVIFAYLVILCDIPCISALIKVQGNLILMLDNFMVTIPLICINIKLITLWAKKRDIAGLFGMMADDWHQRKTPKERTTMKKYANTSRFIVCLGLFFFCCSIAIINIAIFSGKLVRTETSITDIPGHLLAMQTSYFYDITKGHRYILTKLSQLVYCIMGGICYTFPDGLFGVLVLHTCAQLEILSGRFKTITKAPRMDCFALRSLILKHYEIIRFIAVVEDIFNLLILSLVFFFTVVFTILAFQLITTFTNDAQMPLFQTSFFVMYVMYFLFLMFIYSWVGQNLIDQCENLNVTLYDCNWYSLSSNQSLLLLPILIRSQRSLIITIGKMAPVKLESFLRLIKTCVGYVSFLAAIKN